MSRPYKATGGSISYATGRGLTRGETEAGGHMSGLGPDLVSRPYSGANGVRIQAGLEPARDDGRGTEAGGHMSDIGFDSPAAFERMSGLGPDPVPPLQGPGGVRIQAGLEPARDDEGYREPGMDLRTGKEKETAKE